MYQPILGQIVLEITCADCADLLNRMNRMGITGRNINYSGNLEMCITVSGSDYHRISRLVKNMGGLVRIKRLAGIHNFVRSIKKRPIGLLMIICLLFITIWIPRRVFFIAVDGNVSVPANRIIEAAENCGLRFGASRQSIRSEVVKNALLQEISQLQWVGVNTSGCTATISVREKTTNDVKDNTEKQVCSIVAIRDGIIQDCTVYQGNQLCVSGQAVKAGQILVSGYMDCGTTIKATRADAEITALTFRDLEVLTPDATAVRGREKARKNNYFLRVGKKIINLSKDSGNLDAGCVKIYLEKSVCLPGGFTLPFGVIRETIITFEDEEQMPIISENAQWLENYSLAYLKSSMIAGAVVSSQTELVESEGLSCLRGRFACSEMIGQVKFEQTLLKD